MAELEKDIVTLKVIPKKKITIEIGTSSIIGTRSKQEDTIFGYGSGSRAIAVICDGMGGLEGGELASQAAVKSLVGAWFDAKEIEDIPQFFKDEAIRADEKVFLQENEKGERIQAGTTMAAVIIRNNELYWLSVGDSKIYIVRGEEIMAVCREHNYRLALEQRLKQGTLTPQEYAAEEHHAGALISYLGMGNVSLMDRNLQPFLLEDGDIILLSSDGLYRSLTEENILMVISENRENMQHTAEALTAKALGDKTSGQDNTSVVILEYSLKG